VEAVYSSETLVPSTKLHDIITLNTKVLVSTGMKILNLFLWRLSFGGQRKWLKDIRMYRSLWGDLLEWTGLTSFSVAGLEMKRCWMLVFSDQRVHWLVKHDCCYFVVILEFAVFLSVCLTLYNAVITTCSFFNIQKSTIFTTVRIYVFRIIIRINGYYLPKQQ
jgi:hypothetical protein